MSCPETHQQLEFSFEGQFLGFACHNGKPKYLRLETLSEEMWIKLPKALRLSVAQSLRSGAPIAVTGRARFDRHTQQLKLKAAQITPLQQSEPQPHPAMPETSPPSAPQPNFKVFVCQKSGCLKKNGKGLCEALEKTLRDRQLNQYVTIKRTGCLKRCSSAPNAVLMPGNHRYTEVRSKTVTQIADAIARKLAAR